jgi:peptide/nickel transport system substrate-binding protein
MVFSLPSAQATFSSQQPEPRQGGVFRSAELGGAPRLLHPYPEPQQYTAPWVQAASLMWASLIDVDYETLDYVVDPRTSMATSLPTISNEGRTFTFTLRDDLRWSDGTPITSADFQFAWDNARLQENNWVGYNSTIERIESFTTPDPLTVEVTLTEQLARFLAMGIAAGIGPVPRHVWEGRPWLDPQANPEVLRPSVVSGPYIPQELSVERHSYTRNPNWWGKAPNLDEIVFISASPATVLELLRTRQAEWAHNFPPAQYNDARRIEHANVLEWTAAAGTYRVMEMNLARPLLADKRVREALSRAVNRADLVQLEDDLAIPQFGIFTEASRWRNDSVERYDFDLSRARRLLEDAGYRLDGRTLRDRNGQPVRLEIIWPTTSQPRGKIATYLQQVWRDLGIEATVTGLEFNAFIDKHARQKDFDVAMGGWASTLDPDSARSLFMTGGGQNSVGYSNARVDALFEQGAREQDDVRRKQIYDEVQRILLDDLAMYPMTTLKTFTAIDRRVAGVSPRRGDDLLTDNNAQFLDWFIAQ